MTVLTSDQVSLAQALHTSFVLIIPYAFYQGLFQSTTCCQMQQELPSDKPCGCCPSMQGCHTTDLDLRLQRCLQRLWDMLLGRPEAQVSHQLDVRKLCLDAICNSQVPTEQQCQQVAALVAVWHLAVALADMPDAHEHHKTVMVKSVSWSASQTLLTQQS